MSDPLIARFSGVPVIACQERADLFASCLQGALGHVEYAKIQAATMSETEDGFWPASDSWLAAYRPYTVRDGILVIPVKGALIHNFNYSFHGYITGYEYIKRAFDRGMADSNVRGIALDIESPGGEVAGNFDLVDHMFAARGTKPVAAFANEYAYSAAYSIASVADKLYVSRTGGVGSIGVVTSHLDMSKMLDKQGVAITFIHAGKYKVEGNPYEPLSVEAKARIQSRIDTLYNVFVSTVARNRNISEQAVRDTEALTYTADEAVEIGLADKVASFDSAMELFSTEIKSKGLEMSDKQEKPAAFAQADVDAARAEGKAEGAKAERERIKGITGSDAGKTRAATAFHLSMNTNLTVEEAVGVLALTPEDKPFQASSNTPFEAAMAKGNPDVGSGMQGDSEKAEKSSSASILADFRAAGGAVQAK